LVVAVEWVEVVAIMEALQAVQVEGLVEEQLVLLVLQDKVIQVEMGELVMVLEAVEEVLEQVVVQVLLGILAMLVLVA
jgi:hypothetical protein